MIVVAVVASVLLAAAPAGAAPGGVRDAAKRCTTEFASLRGAGGETFTTVGECTRYAARGGEFVELWIETAYSPYYTDGFLAEMAARGLSEGATGRWRVYLGGNVLFTLQGSSQALGLLCSASGQFRVELEDTVNGAVSSVTLVPPPTICP
jgi:hypothetical protein